MHSSMANQTKLIEGLRDKVSGLETTVYELNGAAIPGGGQPTPEQTIRKPPSRKAPHAAFQAYKRRRVDEAENEQKMQRCPNAPAATVPDVDRARVL